MITPIFPLDNSEDIIDSRTVIERIEALEEMDELDDDEAEELASLKVLASEGEDNFSDWAYGETLVRDSFFRTYAEQLAEDICPSRELQAALEIWPYRHIDWEVAARELKYDYSSVDFDGVEYWGRS